MVSLAQTSEREREAALRRWQVLRSHVEDGVPLGQCAAAAGVSSRTAQRWLARYREAGLAGLSDRGRSDHGTRQLPVELVRMIEGLALRRPRPTVAFIHRQTGAVSARMGWRAPSYATVYAIVRDLDPGLVTLAHEGTAAYRDRYELAMRREASAPNEIWQADHTQLDVLVLDDNGAVARPWLTVVLDDHSRAVAGYSVFLAAPSALQTALALRQAILTKPQPNWPVCGLPGILYSDHGSDFTSRHLEQVCADLHVRLVHSTAGVPQGRGKVERYFGTITTELLPTLPGQLVAGRPATPPRLSLTQLDAAIERFVLGKYLPRTHPETGQTPHARWIADGWLPRMVESPETLELLLLTVAKPRMVHRDGIRFQRLRYFDLALAGYVGEPVTIRYDPRDLGQISVFHHDRFLCRAVSPELATRTISLRDLRAARNARRRELRNQINQRRSLANELSPAPGSLTDPAQPTSHPSRPRAPSQRLKLYRED